MAFEESLGTLKKQENEELNYSDDFSYISDS